MKKTALVIALTTFGICSAHAEGFVKSSDGSYVKTKSSECLNHKHADDQVPECDKELKEKLDRLAKEEQDRLAKDEQDRLDKDEQDRLAQEEKNRQAKRVVIDSVKNVTFDANTSFAIGKSVLRPAGKDALAALAAKLQSAVSEIDSIRVSGHTDSTGSKKLNDRLSQQRADAVKNYLISQGIDANLITATGYGSNQPVASNKTKAGRAQNRRAVVEVQAKQATVTQ